LTDFYVIDHRSSWQEHCSVVSNSWLDKLYHTSDITCKSSNYHSSFGFLDDTDQVLSYRRFWGCYTFFVGSKTVSYI